jgi:hypothetical protein
MDILATKSCEKVAQTFRCEFCDYTTCKKSSFDKHSFTLKHQFATKSTEKLLKDAQKYNCENCSKSFQHRSGLWRHKKTCIVNSSLLVMEDSKDIVLHLLNQNKQLQEQIIELCKDKSITNNTITNMNNSHNKTFNLQVFLNETCKDAMNLTDFVDSLQIQISDLEKVGKDGFVAGISNIILKNLKALDVTMRPVHCSDQKRETMYIKDQNEWHNDSKELPENQKLKKAIKQIAHKNICKIPEWKKLYPDCIYAESRKSDLYNHIMYEAMDHNEANSEKIIKKIAKEVGISKTSG